MTIPNLSIKNWLIVGAIGVVIFLVIVSRIGHTKASTVIPEVPVGKPTSSVESNKKTEDVVASLNRELDQVKKDEVVKNNITQQQNPLAQQQAMQAQQMQQMAMQQAYLRSQNYGAPRRESDTPTSGEKSFVLSFKDEPKVSGSGEVTGDRSGPSVDFAKAGTKVEDKGGFACGSEDDYWSSCIPEGSVLMATITNSLRGDFTGPVMAQISQPFMSKDKKHVLVPAGTMVLGESGRVGGQEQSRLEIVFHRMILSDGAAYHHAGWSVSLDKLQGLSVDGSAGQEGSVNHHWGSTIAASAAYGLLAGFSLAGTGSYLTGSGTDMYRQGISQSVGQQGQQQLSRMVNRLPTITVPAGSECSIYIASDLRMKQ